jgi:putative transposase
MARAPRCLRSDVVYHVHNRRTDKQCLFPEPALYEDTLKVLRRGKQKYEARIHAFCLFYNHVHLAVSAHDVSQLVRFLHWTSTTHAIRFRLKTGTRGLGHVYQDRYKDKPVGDCVHYATLIRYIERNPLEAGLVERAEDWQWSSLRERMRGEGDLIEPGPWRLPDDWLSLVNAPEVDMYEIPSLLGQTSLWMTTPSRPAFE